MRKPIDTAPKSDDFVLIGCGFDCIPAFWHGGCEYLDAGWYNIEDRWKFDNLRKHYGIHCPDRIPADCWFELPARTSDERQEGKS